MPRQPKVPPRAIPPASAPPAPAANAAAKSNARQLAKAVAEVKIRLASIEEKLDSLLNRLALVEQRISMLECVPKPAVPALPPQYHRNPMDFRIPCEWPPSPWRPNIAWCGYYKHGKLSGYNG